MLTRLTFLGFVIAVASVSVADEQASGLVFEKDVAPILKVKCIKCHNSKARKAELDLGSFTSLSKGGESGAILDAENPKEGVLYEYIHDGTMPPEDAKPLTSREKETLLQWIRSGAKSQASAAPQVSQHDVIPILNLRCTVCHGLRQKSAGLDLRTKQSMLKGGKSGPAFVPGKPEESLMLKKIHAKDMPPPARLIPDGVRPVDATELKILTQWIAYGAPIIEVAADVATTESDALVTDEDRQFWAFQKPVRPKPPAVKNQTQVRTPVDAFLLKKLEAAGLSYNEQADRMTAIRRVAFDLTGLPPDWKDVERFLADQSNDAHAKIVDRFLASPRYGERWGQYWLDLSGYADSEGKRSADPIRPHAWRYRDYVVRSFNMDKPYDRFLLEQIAGDELVDYENAKEITQPMMDNLVATAFLRMAPDGTGSDIVNTVEERFEVIADELQVFGSAILGLTLECAKCHSHKYDPIPQRDYYRLMATFKGAYDEHDWLKPSFVPGQTKAKKPGRVLTHVTSEVTKKWEADKAAIQRQIYDINTVIAKQREEVRNRLLAEKLKSIPEVIRSDVEQAIRTNDKKRSEVQKYLAKKFSKQLTFDEKALAAADSKYKKAAADAAKKIKELQTDMPKAPQIRALWDRGEPSNTYIYLRGQITTPGRLVGPGVLSVLTDGKTPFTPTAPWPGSNKTGRRLALANWLISKDHPLTARVMVNRIWFH
ncbi:MAG: hypothetical protein CMJ78_19415, partial [Planctomycetaceae bacterium]|nr:hypothetical protein [Planctomycetaceae bacterium]